MFDAILDHLDSLTVGEPEEHEALRLQPLFAPATGPEVHTLTEALGRGDAEVTEVSESGRVPELLVHNKAARALLLLDGEELVGAKQNRILNASILVGSGVRLQVPVSCIERGRWRRTSHAFASRGRVMPSSMRSSKATRVSRSLRGTGRFDADQGTVWQEVTEFNRTMGVRSRTDALSDALDAAEERMQRYVASLPPRPGQVGMAVWQGGRLAGVELMGRPEAWAAAHERLLRSYAADAIGAEASPGPPDPEDAVAFLRSALRGERTETPSPGQGTDVRVETGTTSVAALVAPAGLACLTLFLKRAA